MSNKPIIGIVSKYYDTNKSCKTNTYVRDKVYMIMEELLLLFYHQQKI